MGGHGGAGETRPLLRTRPHRSRSLQLFAAKRFNVVLLDRNLPDMDGIEVARQMRAMESDGLQAILLAVTAYCTAEDRALSLQAGMDAFVGKPLTPDKLRKVLLAAGQRLLSAASLHVAPEPPAQDLNLSLLNYLSDASTGGLEAQIERFLATLEAARAEIVTALQARDFATIAAVGHRVLGQARMIGATALGATATELETAAKAENAAACHQAFQQLSEEIQVLMGAMRRRSAVPSA
jgi:two-component system, sensor histidine kinase and response regulator